MIKGQSPNYGLKIIRQVTRTDHSRNTDNISLFNIKQFSQKVFFPQQLQFNIYLNVATSQCYSAFKKSILKFIRPSGNTILNGNNLSGIKSISELRLIFSYLTEHAFMHNFSRSLCPIFCWRDIIELTTPSLFYYLDERVTFGGTTFIDKKIQIF